MDKLDLAMEKEIFNRKKTKENYEDLFDRVIGISLSNTEARKELRGIENWLSYKRDNIDNNAEVEINEQYKNYNEKEDLEYKELAELLVKTKRTLQKTQDTLRIERKAWRESNREIGTVEALTDSLIEVLKERGNHLITVKHDIFDFGKPKGIVQFTDIHGNECVDIIGNKYTWEILSKRIKKHTQENIRLFKSMGVEEILIAQTGDLLNSDRRLGELLTNSTNRAKAIFIISEILTQSILEYNQHFNVNIASVIGNESRIGEDVHFEDQLASNNFDFTINRIIYTYLENKEGINFIPMSNSLEDIVEVNGQNILLLHGNTFKGQNPRTTLPKIKAKYVDKGVFIRFVLLGHLHETDIGSNHARSGSTVGDNAYSFYGLHLSGRASQNSYLVYEDGTIHSTAIDLQNVEGIEGYKFDTFVESYKNKSLNKFKTENGIKIYKV